ncbi:MAG: substrate-binding domain-containing protein [Acidimicrobiales bacterium]|nr:substrate-binding domain-containing protein [Acidimicrobiales bacterium]
MGDRGGRRHGAVKLLAAAIAIVVAACASGSSTSPDREDSTATSAGGGGTTTTVASVLSGADAVAAAEEGLQPWLEGTFRPPPDDGPAAVDGAAIYVISCGQLLESCSVLVDGVMDGADSIGWDATLFDTGLDFTKAGDGVRQAIAAGADGAVVVGVDCQHFSGALDEANAADFPVVVLNAFDCDVTSDGEQDARFAAQVSFTPEGQDPEQGARDFAGAKVDFGVVETDAELKVINLTQDDLLAITLLGEGFEQAVGTCGSCELVDTVTFSTGDLLDGSLPQKVASSIVAHPEANAISFPYAAAVQLGLPGIADAGRDDLLVLGAEGMPSQYDLLADGQIDMVMAFPADWTGWAAIDTLNRIFQGAETVDEGVGYQLLTADTLVDGNEPPAPPYDFEATYREVWGV